MLSQTSNCQALWPHVAQKHGNGVALNIGIVGFGALCLVLLAQISIYLPFTPVPITGQTFGVAMIALLWGKRRGVAAVLSYLTLGIVGLPVFALGKAFTFGPTVGYLVGMLVASFVMGALADRGWTSNYKTTWLALILGSAITFSFGLLGLSFFVPHDAVLSMGLFPFLIGDFIKTISAVTLVTGIHGLARSHG